MRKYTKEHEWVDIDGDEATVGITAHAAEQLGTVIFIELPEIDTEFKKSDPCAVVESTKAASDIYVPLSGKITAINEALIENPTLINEKPFEAWFYKCTIKNTAEIDELLDEPVA